MAALKAMLSGVPDGATVGVILTAKPKTTAEFEAIVEAAGGAGQFKVGFHANYLCADLDDGVWLQVEPPADAAIPAPKGHPFIREFAKQIKAAQTAEGGEES